MTVEEMMATMSSYEYARWIAFERSNGPIGGYQMQQEVLSSLHEQVQLLNYLTSQANFTNEDHRKGPVPPPQRFPRPYDKPGEELETTLDVDLSEEWVPASEYEESCPPDCKCNGGTRRPTGHF